MHGERNTRNESEVCPIDKYRLGHRSENHTSENVSEGCKTEQYRLGHSY